MKKIEIIEEPFSDNGKDFISRLHWDDARVFLAIARTGTLSAAAKTMGIGLATISRRIERLEDSLGVSLFSRHQGGYQLTDDAVALLVKAEALEQAGFAFGSAAEKLNQVIGNVRLATGENLANLLIIPALPKLLELHPDLSIDIVTDVKTVNLHRRDADLAIRMVKPEAGNITIRRLGTIGFGLYGASDYVQNRQKDSVQEGAFDGDQFITWSEAFEHIPSAQWVKRVLHGRKCLITMNTVSGQVVATQAGIGLAVLPHYLAKRAGLVCVQEQLDIFQPVWLAIHSDLVSSRRVRVVADYLTDLFLENEVALLSG